MISRPTTMTLKEYYILPTENPQSLRKEAAAKLLIFTILSIYFILFNFILSYLRFFAPVNK